MDLIRKLYVKAKVLTRGQTMAEYALLLASVALIVYSGYQTMGASITSVLTKVDGKL